MKKRKVKKTPKILLILILLLSISGVSIYIYKQPHEYASIPNIPDNKEIITEMKDVKPAIALNNITNNSGKEIKEEWQNLIISYLDLYFKSLSYLEVEDFSSLFTNPDGAEAHLTNKATELIVEHHKMQDYDMSLNEARYDINYKSISIKGNTITIDVLRNDYMKFKYLKGIESKVYNMTNTFVIKDIDGKCSFESIRIVQDYYIMFTRVLNMNSSNIISKIDELEQKYLDNSRKEVETNRKLKEDVVNYTPSKTYQVAYDRDKAYEYAKEYVDKRNSEFPAYDNTGGNCMNYASQVMYAGGIPMDRSGGSTWYHYIVGKSSSGKTSSWTSTNYFYKYANNNSGYGLVSEVDVNIFAGEKGDIAQVGFDGYSHTTVVVGSVKDSEDKVVDILINCNTLSLENFPFLAYVYQNKRLIKILGYNE